MLQARQEVAEGAYHETIDLVSYIIASLPYDIISFSLSIFIILRLVVRMFTLHRNRMYKVTVYLLAYCVCCR